MGLTIDSTQERVDANNGQLPHRKS